MEEFWLEEECLTVLQQSSVLEFALPPSNHLNLESHRPPITLHKKSTESMGDSASSAVSLDWDDAPVSPSKQPIELEAENEVRKKNAAVHEENAVPEIKRKDDKNERVRSWSGSPDWDFKEGCSYSVQSDRMSDELGFLASMHGLDFREEGVLFQQMKSSTQTGDLLKMATGFTKAPKIRCDNNLRVEEDLAVMDSARDVQWRKRLSEDYWDVAFPSTTSSFCNPSDRDKSESTASSYLASGTIENDTTPISLGRFRLGQGSLLRRVQNEVDVELLEGLLEEEDEIESLDDASSSYSDGSDDDGPCGHHRAKSTAPNTIYTVGHILNLVVGIGACAVFQILK